MTPQSRTDRRRLLVGLGIATLCLNAAHPPARAASQSPVQPDLVSRIDAAVEAARTAQHVPGISVGVLSRGKVVLAKGYGVAELENDVPATEHTVYRIGSVTKQFTAAAIMTLVEDGRLSLDDDITKFLPTYPTRGHRISIDRLLTHTSGIKGYTEMPAFRDVMRQDLSHQQLIDLFSAAPFEFDPGERYQYNNSAYFLLGVIIEQVSGTSYSEFLAKRVFERAGLLETYYLDESPIVKHRAQGYEYGGGHVVNDEFLSMALPYAAGSLGSTVVDLMTWRQALTSGKVVTPASYARMTTPATLNDGSKTTYGYGLALATMEGHRKVTHGGGINGFRADLAYYPDEDLTVVVLCNSGSAKPDLIGSRIARLVLGVPESAATPTPLGEAELKRYVGVYHPGRSPMPVTMAGGHLVLSGTPLVPVGPHRFVAEDDPYLQVRFTVEGTTVQAMTVEREGQTTVARRLPTP